MGTFAKGAKLEAMIGAALTPIANLTSLGFPEISTDEVDVSSHDSVDNYREFVPGMIDGGSLDIEGNFTGDEGIKTLIDSGEVIAFTITTASGKTAEFSGFFTSFAVDLPFEGKETFSASIKVSGKVTIGDVVVTP